MRSREQSDNMAVVMVVTLSFVGNSDPMCSSGARTQFAREKMNVQKHFEEKQKKKTNLIDIELKEAGQESNRLLAPLASQCTLATVNNNIIL